MTAIQLRTEVKKLVDKTSDLGFLEQLKQLLLRSESDRTAFVEMNRMADLSDEAIRKGDVFTHEEVVKHLHHRRKRK
jgi:RNA polymerase-interacting CarD/CdnL/TRCF family regulator